MNGRKRSTINLNPLEDIKSEEESIDSTSASVVAKNSQANKQAKSAPRETKISNTINVSESAEEIFDAIESDEASSSHFIMGDSKLIVVEVSGDSAEEIFNQSNSASLKHDDKNFFFKSKVKKKSKAGTSVALIEQAPESPANDIVQKYSEWSILAGLVPVHFLDTAAVTGVQLKMILELCKLYEVPFRKESASAIISSLIASNVTTGASHFIGLHVVKKIPVVGSVINLAVQPAMSYASTHALGTVFIAHFEKKGSLIDFEIGTMKVSFADSYEKAKKIFKGQNFTRRFLD
jgi:uncharacterized protein (DUF697 family)